MSLSEILTERGYVHQHSAESLEAITDGPKRTVYQGFDPSADSLHIGNLMGMLVMRRFLEAGHKVIMLIGGGTGMIGDPSGKSEERVLLTAEQVAHNTERLAAQAKHIFGSDSFTVVDNAEWLSDLSVIDFLRDTGKHFSVNAMLQRDSVKERINRDEQGISYTEFSYMLLQAYDFLYLHKKYGCDWQHGSSDQWGNIVSGIDLVRRHTGNTVYGTTHGLLINKATGKKFGKSEQGAVWLDPAKTSVYQFYQFFLNVEDEMATELLFKLTMMPGDEIRSLVEAHGANPGARLAQKELARAVTTIVHGSDMAANAEHVSSMLFGEKTLAEVSDAARALMLNEAPNAGVKLGKAIVDALVESGLASSKREARQFVEDGAVMLGDEVVRDVAATLEEKHFTSNLALLKRGKRNVAVLVLD